MKLFFLLPLFFSFTSLKAQNNLNIVPVPAELKAGKENFKLTPATNIILEGSGLQNTATYFNDYLKKNYGFKLNIRDKKTGAGCIVLNFERLDNPLPGAYTMQVNSKEIYIGGDNESGVFYGIQTLIQLLPVNDSRSQLLNIPQVNINDYPRFAYRGMHLDVARHFFPVDYVKKYIDYLALHKFNNFHWHLTDDQGWRIAIKKYPG